MVAAVRYCMRMCVVNKSEVDDDDDDNVAAKRGNSSSLIGWRMFSK